MPILGMNFTLVLQDIRDHTTGYKIDFLVDDGRENGCALVISEVSSRPVWPTCIFLHCEIVCAFLRLYVSDSAFLSAARLCVECGLLQRERVHLPKESALNNCRLQSCFPPALGLAPNGRPKHCFPAAAAGTSSSHSPPVSRGTVRIGAAES